MTDSVLLDFPSPIRPIAHIRSTLLLGGIEAIKSEGYGEAYLAALAPDIRQAIELTVAGMWLPVRVAHGHYTACDSLGISSESAVRIGRGTFTNTKGLLLGAALGLARGVGVTPWTLTPHFQRFWMRGYDGAGLRIVSLGPKDLRLELVTCSLARSRYYRAALRGVLVGVLELVASKAYAHEIGHPADDAVTMRAQWA